MTPQRKRVLELLERCGSGRYLVQRRYQQLRHRDEGVTGNGVSNPAPPGRHGLQELELSEGQRFELAVEDHRQHDHVCASAAVAQRNSRVNPSWQRGLLPQNMLDSN